MYKRLLFFLLLLIACASGTYTYGQSLYPFSISGYIVTAEDSLPISAAEVELHVNGTVSNQIRSNDNGYFFFNLSKAGNYHLTVKTKGRKMAERKLTLNTIQARVNLGNLALADNTVRLKVATVKGRARLQVMRGDTVIYNPAAMRLTDNATLADMLEQIPGIKVEGGEILWQGKNISQILVNGQEFFGDNKAIALKNLPTYAIQNIKAYDKQSEFAEHTGIEDGKKRAVLDVTLKKEYQANWIGNAVAAGGTHNQYNANIFGTRFTNRWRTSVIAQTTSLMPGFIDLSNGNLLASGVQEGANHNQQYAGELVWNNGRKTNRPGYLNVNAHVEANNYDQQTNMERAEESYLPDSKPAYFFQKNTGRNKQNFLKGQATVKWQMDTLTYGRFNLNFNHYRQHQKTENRSATYDEAPYEVAGERFPLDGLFSDTPPEELLAIAVNRNRQRAYRRGRDNALTASALIIRRLNGKGRNITLDGTYTLNKKHDTRHTLADIVYYRQTDKQVNRQYIPQTMRNTKGTVALKYSEPLAKQLALTVGYRYTQESRHNDRPLYQLDRLQGAWADTFLPLETLPSADSLDAILNARNSIFSTYHYYNHAVDLKLSYTGKLWRVAAGVALRPERTRLDYLRDRLDTTVIRNLCYLSPNLYVKRNLGKSTTLDATYSATEKYPELTYMLDITDDADPLNVTRGNPDLKPSWTHNATINTRTYLSKTDFSLNNNLRFTATSRDISNTLHYDPTTGVRTLQPRNVNGNWLLRYNANTDFKLDSIGRFRLNPSGSIGYRQYHGMVSTTGDLFRESRTNVLNGNLSAKTVFKQGKARITLWAAMDWEQVRNNLQPSLNQEHYLWEVGSQQFVTLPFNVYLNGSIRLRTRDGYSQPSMNYTDCVWDLTVGRSFLKSKRLNVELFCSDLLHGQKRRFYTQSAYTNAYSRYQYTDSFLLLTVSYRLSTQKQ